MTDTRQVLHRPLRLPLLTAIALSAGLTAMPASATNYLVNTTADNVAMDGSLSLREAVTAASSNAAVGDAPAGEASGDTITIGAVTYPLTQGELAVSGTTTITGGGTIDGSSSSRIFSISGTDTVTLDNLTLQNGRTSALALLAGVVESRNGGDNVNGGAIKVNAGATLVLTNMTLMDNVASGAAAGEGGGAIFNAGTLTISDSVIASNGVSGAAGNGGGILNSVGATLTITDTAINANSANRAGGGIENNGGTVSLTNTTLSNNTVGNAPGNGGGMHQGGGSSVTIVGGSITGNTAGREGGGLWAAATSSIDGTSITDNVALGLTSIQGGAGLFNQGGDMTVVNATITGNVAITDNDGTGSASGGGILNNAGGTLIVTDSTISTNKANRAGGGIEDNGGTVTLTNVIMDGNEAGTEFNRPGNGGAVHVGGGAITVNGGSFTNNIAAREGGGLWTTTATINDATITGNEGQGPESNRGGGGLFNQAGMMTVTDSTIDNNRATGTSGSGGGIINNGGTLRIDGGSVSGNTANRAGGALEDIAAGGTVTITGVTMDNNIAGVDEATATPGNGGAIHITGAAGDMMISESMFSGNIAALEGGALWNFGGGSSMTVAGSTIDGNTAMGAATDAGGGGIYNDGGTLTVDSIAFGTGPAVGIDEDGNQVELGEGSFTLIPMVISNNVANGTSGSGGGILNNGGTLMVSNTSLTGNTANRAGGAIEDTAGAITTLTRVTLDGNTASGGANGASTEGDSAPGNGGGYHITGGGTLTVDQSTVSNNTAANEGGGLWNHAASTTNVYNSTVSGNTATEGAGIYSQDGSTAVVTLINATVANNSGAGIETGGEVGGATINLTNTIVADNTADILATSVNADNSLIEVPGTTAIVGDNNITGVDPQLGALADNGGSTFTQLASSGPAVDGGDNAVCSGAEINNIDQRGITRPAPDSNLCDIGATESAAMPAAAAVANNPANRNIVDGDQNVPAVGFTLNSSDEGITITSVSGVITGGGDRSLISDGQLLRGGVPVAGSFMLTEATGAFSIVLDSGEIIAEDDMADFSITLDFGSPAAGLALLALPLFGLLWLRRSKLALILLAAGGLTLAACSDTEDNLDSFRVTVQQVQATGNTTGGTVVTSGLPIAGARLTRR